MDTIGSLIDKLNIANLKMWWKQEDLYKIRRMSLEDFKAEFFNEKGIEGLYNILNSAADLNVQRNNLIDEIDKTIIQLVKLVVEKEDISKFFQDKHKTY